MSLTTTSSSFSFVITSLPQAFSVPFQFAKISEVSVTCGGVLLSSASDYTVIGGGYNSLNELQPGSGVISNGGTNASVVVIGATVVVSRNTTLTQSESFVVGGMLTPLMIEAGLDQSVALYQEAERDIAGLAANVAPSKVINVNTVSDLRAYNVTGLATGATVNLLGYYAAGDGGGGLFYYDSASVASDNGGTFIAKWIRIYSGSVNVRWFGAKGDGSTNDTLSFTMSFSIGGTIYVPSGNYRTSTIIIPDNVSVIGDGIGTLFTPYYGTTSVLIALGNYSSLKKVSIYADKAISPLIYCVYASGKTGVVVEDITISKGSAVSIYIDTCVNAVLNRCNAKSSSSSVIVVSSCSSGTTRIENCDFDASGVINHGVSIRNSSNVVVDNCRVYNATVFNISTDNSSKCIISNNTLFDSTRECINIQDGHDCIVTNNSASWSGSQSLDFGISLYGQNGSGAYGHIVIGNNVSGSGKSGIVLASATTIYNCSIVGNLVARPNRLNETQGAGILLYGPNCIKNLVSGNHLWDDASKMKYGVNEYNDAGQPSYNTITGNRIYGEVTSKVFSVNTTLESINGKLLTNSSWTPVVTSLSGTITAYTASGYFYKIETMVFFSLQINISNNGTGAGAVLCTLPITSSTTGIYTVSGRESALTGTGLVGLTGGGTSSVTIRTVNNSYPGGTGAVINISGFYEHNPA